MPTTLIEQKPSFVKKVEGSRKLAIAEMFCNTMQGEGISAGVPATFMRLQGCTLQCTWCDTLDVWPQGNEYSFDEIFEMFAKHHLIYKFMYKEQRLVLTGGSPLKQQDALVMFLEEFHSKYGFAPYIEVENEAVLKPSSEFNFFVRQWNNSPKLENSGMKERVRYKPEILKCTARLENSWFKFVISDEKDWNEIQTMYLNTQLIERDQIILMPEGDNKEKLLFNREKVVEIAIRESVRFSDRLHITIWNKKTSV
jgi:organic radical activating enzyme